MLAGQIFGHNYYWIFGSVATPDLTTSGSVCASRVTALTVPATATREHALIADAVRLELWIGSNFYGLVLCGQYTTTMRSQTRQTAATGDSTSTVAQQSTKLYGT
jgi:hypothetical protein